MSKIRTFSSNTELVDKRRQQIIRSARQLFVKKGYDRTTMRDIGKACRMTSAGVYHYLGKKEDILSLVVQHVYKQLYAFIREAEGYADTLEPAMALSRAMDRYYRLLDENREDALFINNNYTLFKPALRLQVWETVASVVAVFEKIIGKIGRGCGSVIDNGSLLAFNIVALGQMWFLRRNYLAARHSIDEYIEYQTEQVFKQIGGGRLKQINR